MKNKKIVIIIADDDADDQLLARHAISESGIPFELVTVSNGRELIDLLLRNPPYDHEPPLHPDLMILDVNMPVLDGFKALEKIRANNALKHIPVYMLSTSDSGIDKKMAEKLGANGFFTKAMDFKGLAQTLRDICSRHDPNS
jgi:CheY-like chemotaxis protein